MSPRHWFPLRPMSRTVRRSSFRPTLESLEDRALLSGYALAFEGAGPGNDNRTAPGAAAEFVPGEILIGLETASISGPLAPGATGLLAAAQAQVGGLGLHGPKVLFELPSGVAGAGRLVTKWSVDPATDIPALAERLARLPGIAYAEPNGIITAAFVEDASFTATPESDWGSRFGLQEHLTGQTASGTLTSDIGAVGAWNAPGVNYGGGVRVAVLDSGIDLDHPDLVASLARNPDGSVLGANFVTPGASVQDDHGHGTHVSGILAAALNNTGDRALGTSDTSWNGGIVGVAPGVEILPVKMLDHTGTATVSSYVESLEWAVAQGAQVVNMSLGRSIYYQSIYDAVTMAYQSNVLVVAAAHNQNSSSPMYPGAHPMTIGVAAVDKNDVKASFSNYGGWVDISAPGVSILSTLIDDAENATDGYARWSGTSMAAPMVAGVAALILAQNPTWTPAQVAAQIVGTADDIYGVAGNENHVNMLGSGRVNALAAVTRTLGRPQVVGTPGIFERFSLNDPILVRFSQGMSPDIDVLSNGQPAYFEVRRDADGDGLFAASERVPLGFYDYDGSGGMPADYVLGPTLALALGELNAGYYQLIVKGGENGVKDAFGNSLGDSDGNALAEFISNFTIESVTRTFTNVTTKTLKDNALTASTLNVSLPGSNVIKDLDVLINISHLNVGDLQVVLRSPQGVAITLASNNGGTGDHFVNTIFDDASSQTINQGVAPFTGRFRVTTAGALQLAAVNDSNPNGTWTLEIRDTARNGIAGTLTSWALYVATAPGQAAPTLTLSINDVSKAEGNSGWTAFTFTVTLSAPSTQTVTVYFTTANGTASSSGGSNSDYQAQSGTLTFAPGQTTATITILVRGDTKNEADEAFSVLLSNPLGATIDDNVGMGTILNDD